MECRPYMGGVSMAGVSMAGVNMGGSNKTARRALGVPRAPNGCKCEPVGLQRWNAAQWQLPRSRGLSAGRRARAEPGDAAAEGSSPATAEIDRILFCCGTIRWAPGAHAMRSQAAWGVGGGTGQAAPMCTSAAWLLRILRFEVRPNAPKCKCRFAARAGHGRGGAGRPRCRPRPR